MKVFNFLFLCLFFMIGPIYYIDGSCYKKNLATECFICDQTPCQCKEFLLEECNKISLKKLILLFLEKANLQCGNTKSSEKCFQCQHNCPKKYLVTRVLKDILRQASNTKKEEQTIRKIILRALEPSTCEECPCQDYCDPIVQKVLKCILKKAADCDCVEFPCECMLVSSPCGEKYSKYWFRTNKEELRKEISYKPQSTPPCKKCKCCQINKNNKLNVRDDCTSFNKCEKKVFSKYKRKTPTSCISCKKPNDLICPQYFNKDSNNLFSICAEAKECRIKPLISEGSVALSCTQCKPINSPFVQFTRNGCAFREINEGKHELQIRTKYLQINDFTQTNEYQEKEIFNPFIPKCNFPRKKKSKCKKM